MNVIEQVATALVPLFGIIGICLGVLTPFWTAGAYILARYEYHFFAVFGLPKYFIMSLLIDVMLLVAFQIKPEGWLGSAKVDTSAALGFVLVAGMASTGLAIILIRVSILFMRMKKLQDAGEQL